MDISNSTCVITGIRGATAAIIGQRLLAEGARVVGTTRPKADDTRLRETGDRSYSLAVDPLDPSSIRQGLEQILEQFGSVEVWVNIVGGFAMGDAVELAPRSSWDQMWEQNFLTALNCSQAILPLFRRQGCGRLINFGSAAVASGMALAGPYLVSKAAVHALTRTVAAELKGDISCNAILPKVIDTAANRQALPDADHTTWVTPERIATEIIKLIHDHRNGELIML